ncbi:hypothetical protein HMPREF9994_12485, partial [Staphylococcus epidermidis NIHLM088]
STEQVTPETQASKSTTAPEKKLLMKINQNKALKILKR